MVNYGMLTHQVSQKSHHEAPVSVAENFERFLQVALVNTGAAGSLVDAQRRQQFEVPLPSSNELCPSSVLLTVERPSASSVILPPSSTDSGPTIDSGSDIHGRLPIIRLQEGSVEQYVQFIEMLDQAGVRAHIRFAGGKYADGSERNSQHHVRQRTIERVLKSCSSNISLEAK